MLLALTMTLGAVAQTSPFKYVDAEALPTAADGVQVFSFNENMMDMIPMESITKMIKKDGNSSVMGNCLLYTSPSPRDTERSRMPSSA